MKYTGYNIAGYMYHTSLYPYKINFIATSENVLWEIARYRTKITVTDYKDSSHDWSSLFSSFLTMYSNNSKDNYKNICMSKTNTAQ